MRWGRIIAIFVILVLILAVAVWRLRHPELEKTDDEVLGPMAQVQTAPIREGVLTENITAYGFGHPGARGLADRLGAVREPGDADHGQQRPKGFQGE